MEQIKVTAWVSKKAALDAGRSEFGKVQITLSDADIASLKS